MPQDPTQAQPIEVIRNFRGLDDQADSVARPNGTITEGQNVIDSSTGDANRRAGRDLESLDDGNPITLIYDFLWDDASVFPAFVAGTTASYNAPFSPEFNLSDIVVNPSVPGPMPNGPSYLANFSNTPFPDLTSCMRALSEARMFSNAGTDSLSWPSQAFAFDAYEDGQVIGINIRTKEAILYNLRQGYKLRPTLAYGPVAAATPGINIPPNFYFADIFAAGVKEVISELQTVMDNYNAVLLTYIKTRPIEGASSIANYTSGDYFSSTLGVNTWRTALFQLAGLINSKLLFCKNTTTLTSVETKSGTGNIPICDSGGSGFVIHGYSDGMFTAGANNNVAPVVWNGTFTNYTENIGLCAWAVPTNMGIPDNIAFRRPALYMAGVANTYIVNLDGTNFQFVLSAGLLGGGGSQYIAIKSGGNFTGTYTMSSVTNMGTYPASVVIEAI